MREKYSEGRRVKESEEMDMKDERKEGRKEG